MEFEAAGMHGAQNVYVVLDVVSSSLERVMFAWCTTYKDPLYYRSSPASNDQSEHISLHSYIHTYVVATIKLFADSYKLANCIT